MAKSGPLYQVGGIIGRKEVTGQIFYKVHWSGYSSNQDSWEPESNLANCKLLLDMFNAKQEKRVTRSSSKARDFGKVAVSTSDDECVPRVTVTQSKQHPLLYEKQAHHAKGNITPVAATKPTTDHHTPLAPAGGKLTSTTRKAATTPRRRRKGITNSSMSDLTPSRYYLRYSTIKQRAPLHAASLASDDEESFKITNKFQRNGNDGEEDFFVPASSISLSSKHPSWMSLGVAEMVLCLVVLALVITSLWYLQINIKTASLSR